MGTTYYTIGQHRGLGLLGALYVVDIDVGRNAIIVGSTEVVAAGIGGRRAEFYRHTVFGSWR